MRHLLQISLAVIALAVMACAQTHHDSESSAPTAQKNDEALELVNEINQMGTPEPDWASSKLDLFSKRLARLEQLAQTTPAVSRAFVAYARTQLNEARGVYAEDTKATPAELQSDLAELSAMGIPRGTWGSAQMDAFEARLTKVEVAAKQLGDVSHELQIAEMRAELAQERLDAIRQRQSDDLYKQTLDTARASSVKCVEMAEAAEIAADRLSAMTSALDCTRTAIADLSNAMTLAGARQDQETVRVMIEEIAGIQRYKEHVERARIQAANDVKTKQILGLKAECEALRQVRVDSKSDLLAVDNEKNCYNRLGMQLESASESAAAQGDQVNALALRDEYAKLVLGR